MAVLKHLLTFVSITLADSSEVGNTVIVSTYWSSNNCFLTAVRVFILGKT